MKKVTTRSTRSARGARAAQALVLALATMGAQAATAARVIVKGGRVYGQVADTVVVDNGVITAVGKGFSLPARADDVVVDAHGGLILPGFHDSHIHMQGGGLSLVRAQLATAKTLKDTQQVVKDYAAAHPDRPWVLGRGWSYAIVPTGTMPTAAMLDAVVKDKPVFIRAYDGHTGWANSKALELAGITKDTKDPPDGEIVRDKKGNPTGALKEGAQDLMDTALPKPTRDEKKAALLAAANHCKALGLTAVNDIFYDDETFELWTELEDEGVLPIRVELSPPLEPTTGNLDAYAAWRDKLRGRHLVTFGFLKGFLDGVIESKTAYMTHPYEGTKDEVGRPLIPHDKFFALVDQAHARGFQVGVHAIGDAAVRMSLDAFEAAQKAHPDIGVRHRIEHIELVDVADVPRFKQLDVIASMQPYHANPFGNEPEKGPWSENIGKTRWPMTMAWKTLLTAGAPLTFGSDWPVFTASPLSGLALAITRRDENGDPKRGWNAHQAVTVDEALRAYAVERGELAGPAEHIGRIALGQAGDLVVLDQSVRLEDPATIWKGTVTAVIVDGVVR